MSCIEDLQAVDLGGELVAMAASSGCWPRATMRAEPAVSASGIGVEAELAQGIAALAERLGVAAPV